MEVQYEPDGLSAVQRLGLDPIAFAAAVQAWVNINQGNINPAGGSVGLNYVGVYRLVTYEVTNGVFFITDVT